MTTLGGGNEQAEGSAHGYFTDREPFLATFRRMLALPEGSTLPVIAFHGVGGVGKTMLLDRLSRELEGLKPPIPHARFNWIQDGRALACEGGRGGRNPPPARPRQTR